MCLTRDTFRTTRKHPLLLYEPGTWFRSELLERIERPNETSIALSAAADTPKLFELIMIRAKSPTHADGVSLLLLSKDQDHGCYEN